MLYGWTIMRFNYSVSGWLYFLNLGEITNTLTYVLAVNFLESLVVLFGVMAVAVILPKNWFADYFITRGVILSALMFGLMVYVANQFASKSYYPAEIARWLPAILLAIGLVVYVLGRLWFVRTAVEFIADRAIIFLYVSIPLSALSFLAVLARNLF
jgi:hypothetical protein